MALPLRTGLSYHCIMKRRLLGFLAFVALAVFAVAEEQRFTETLTADDFAKAGLS